MFGEIKKQFQINWRDMIFVYVIEIVLVLVGFSFGAGICYSNPKGTFIPVGIILSAALGLLILLILSVVQFMMHFNLSVSMGTSRKNFFLAHMLNTLALHLAALLILAAVSPLEIFAWKLFFPDMVMKAGFWESVCSVLKYGVPAILCEIFTGSLCAALWLRFGKIAGVTLWILWMVLCMAGPRIFSAHMEAPDSFWGKISGAIIGFFTSASVLKLVVSGLIFALIALAGAYACIRKQEVRA